jgi:replicative DNA helicase
LAKELMIPIVIGAQLNRQAADGTPGMHMLRESGAVEQDADVIIILKRRDDNDDGSRIVVDWGIDKWRGGRAGFNVPFIFDKTRQRFNEMYEHHRNPGDAEHQ